MTDEARRRPRLSAKKVHRRVEPGLPAAGRSPETGGFVPVPASLEAGMVRLPESGPIPAGWRVIGARELTEHLLSIRFLASLLILGLAGIVTIYAVAGTIREAASDLPQTATGPLPVFSFLFTLPPTTGGALGQQFPSFAQLVALLGPALGIAFGFDAVSSERADGTLPRLVSQPIHRDDVVNGKFVASLGVIALILGVVTLLLAAIGIIRLGVAPTGDVGMRLLAWYGVAVLYIAFWLALALLCSVLFRRAATAALVVIAAWLILTFFGSQIFSIVGNFVAPVREDATAQQQLANAQLTVQLSRLSPITLFLEMTQALLDPTVRTLDLSPTDPTGRALPSLLPFGQSLLIIWPHVAGLLAATVAWFAAAYITFMRQEVRA
ncbi:MAG: ABC transporter permease [Chloroflexi bacterium]|nr:ABC transporter permease [Chloroflexota bacterium]